MTYHRIDKHFADLLGLALEYQLPERVERWKEHLAESRLTDEMRTVFAGIGWLSSSRDARLRRVEEDADVTQEPDEDEEVEVDESSPPAKAPIREPARPDDDET